MQHRVKRNFRHVFLLPQLYPGISCHFQGDPPPMIPEFPVPELSMRTDSVRRVALKPATKTTFPRFPADHRWSTDQPALKNAGLVNADNVSGLIEKHCLAVPFFGSILLIFGWIYDDFSSFS